VIVRGIVERTTFEVNPSGGLPIATSTVRVLSVQKGVVETNVIVVRQSGGPMAQEVDGALAQLDTGELILPGDDVVLLLRRGDRGYSPEPATGVYFVRDGRTYAQALNPFGNELAGQPVVTLIDTIQQFQS
jgi:hypothetical protein